MENLQATPEDYQELLEQMPLARERLAVIILSRMVAQQRKVIEGMSRGMENVERPPELVAIDGNPVPMGCEPEGRYTG